MTYPECRPTVDLLANLTEMTTIIIIIIRRVDDEGMTGLMTI